MRSALLFLAMALPVLAAPRVRGTRPDEATELPVGQNFRVADKAQADARRSLVKVEFYVWSSNLEMGEALGAPWTAEVEPRDIFGRASSSMRRSTAFRPFLRARRCTC